MTNIYQKNIQDILQEYLGEFPTYEKYNLPCKIKYFNLEWKSFFLKKISIKRSKNGILNLVLISNDEKIRDYFDFKDIKKTKHGILPEIPLILEPLYASKINIENAFVKNISTSSEDICITLRVDKYTEEFCSDKEIKVIKEWYLNGINSYYFFSDNKKESIDINFYREVNTKKEVFNKKLNESYLHDIIKLDLNDFSFYVEILNDNELNIEYREDLGGIPSKSIRCKINRVMSFILDRELFQLGETCYSEDLKILKYSKKRLNKEYQSAKMRASNFFFPEFYFNKNSIKKEFENFKKNIEEVVKNYLEVEEEYLLNLLLSKYFVFKAIPLEHAIPLMASGFEMLSNIVAKKENRENIIPKDMYMDFLNEIEDKIPEELKSKFNNLNSKSIGNKLKNLLEEFNLDYSEYNKYFRIRNNLHHGSTDVTIKQKIETHHKFELLFKILMLKILNYKGFAVIEIQNKQCKLLDMLKKEELIVTLN